LLYYYIIIWLCGINSMITLAIYYLYKSLTGKNA
jgi:hypothetical protein